MKKKKKMSQREASWHETQAGNREKTRLEKQSEHTGLSTLADSTLEGESIAGYTIKPATQGSALAVQEVAQAFDVYAKKQGLEPSAQGSMGQHELLQLALCILAFANPKSTYTRAKQGKIKDLVKEADLIIWEMPIATAERLSEQFAHEMAKIHGVEEQFDAQPGKQITKEISTPCNVTEATMEMAD